MYRTEEFYKDIDKQYNFDKNQLFSADLLNTKSVYILILVTAGLSTCSYNNWLSNEWIVKYRKLYRAEYYRRNRNLW